MKENHRFVACDFDGVICLTTEEPFPAIGEENPGAIPTLLFLKNCGYSLILWTCRTGQSLQDAIVWCGQRGLTFDHVNENPSAGFPTSNKIFAHYYIDDRAIGLSKKTFHDSKGRPKMGVDWDVVRMFFGVRQHTDLDDTVVVLDDAYVAVD